MALPQGKVRLGQSAEYPLHVTFTGEILAENVIMDLSGLESRLDTSNIKLGTAGAAEPTLATGASGLLGYARALFETDLSLLDKISAFYDLAVAGIGRDWSLAFASDKVDVTGSSVTLTNPPADPETGVAKEVTLGNVLSQLQALVTNQFQDGGAVTLTNPPADPETGVAKEVTLAILNDKIPSKAGVLGYSAGTGTETVNISGRLRLVTAVAPLISSATITVAGGDTITLEPGQPFQRDFEGLVVDPAIVFTGVANYYADWVQ